MAIDLTVLCAGDEDLAAIVFPDLGMFPSCKMLSDIENDNIRPSFIQVAVALRGNGLVLQFPEGRGIRKIPFLGEQISNSTFGIISFIEQGVCHGNIIDPTNPLLTA